MSRAIFLQCHSSNFNVKITEKKSLLESKNSCSCLIGKPSLYRSYKTPLSFKWRWGTRNDTLSPNNSCRILLLDCEGSKFYRLENWFRLFCGPFHHRWWASSQSRRALSYSNTINTLNFEKKNALWSQKWFSLS